MFLTQSTINIGLFINAYSLQEEETTDQSHSFWIMLVSHPRTCILWALAANNIPQVQSGFDMFSDTVDVSWPWMLSPLQETNKRKLE